MREQVKFSVFPVKLTPLAPPQNGELSDKVFRKCAFCEKECLVQAASKQFTERIGGPDRFYCVSCLRRRHHTKNRKNILILSFRGIIGHFYYTNYCLMTHGRRMYLADIGDYIDAHAKAGLMNPVFDYDPETYLWFIDFSRVGNSKRKVSIDSVLQTVVDILSCFNLTETVPGVSTSALFNKYKEAIVAFQQRRYRPPERRMLIPTLSGCGPEKSMEKTRSFTANEMCGKKS